VLCCHKNGKRVSKIITGNTNPGLTVIRYETDAEAVNVVQEFTRALAEKQTLP
jgi:hypothetical protein